MEKLVVEGYIDTNGYPYVILTTSLHPTDEPQPIASHVVRWGKVTISDGETSIIMTGGVDSKYFPPFVYKTYYMKGVQGKTYTIEAEYNGLKARASTTILTPPTIIGYRLGKIEGSDSLRSLKIDIAFTGNDFSDEKFLVAFTRKSNSNDQYLPCFLGAFRVDKGQSKVTLPIFQAKSIITDYESYIPNFIVGDTVDIMIANVEKKTFDFWNEFLNQVGFGNSVFMSTSNSPVGNVEGGYGCFTGRGAAMTSIIIKD